ncbi:Response regulator receiver domain-containing protein [Cohaesibacter marisflavi]|uniref:Response regulator receiver domain-containing protein n=1 Tax=Cohaesibacter marisflavi TaxID=655353 RepID=A0A1I5HVE4_9HYPH|nr:response regulator [Cohaesibacter marisflavi]SFO52308.1 Response regulator receiver domain-containing protein [Cohaesibacter marisflavi]
MTKSILVVDDEPTMAFALEQLMKAEGYQVTTASSGQSALDCARKDHPNLILLDSSLPDRDGYDICQTIRKDGANEDVTIIMMNTSSRPIELEKGRACGANGALTKPFSLATAAKTIKDYLT